jgi:hypothetical protein
MIFSMVTSLARILSPRKYIFQYIFYYRYTELSSGITWDATAVAEPAEPLIAPP